MKKPVNTTKQTVIQDTEVLVVKLAWYKRLWQWWLGLWKEEYEVVVWFHTETTINAEGLKTVKRNRKEFQLKDISKKTSFKQLLPGLILIVIYVFVVKTVGFYVTSLIMFFSVVMIYHKREESTDFWRVCVVKLGVSVVFTVVLYLLFTELLNVYPPKGLFL